VTPVVHRIQLRIRGRAPIDASGTEKHLTEVLQGVKLNICVGFGEKITGSVVNDQPTAALVNAV
jgi:hypothetical protein